MEQEFEIGPEALQLLPIDIILLPCRNTTCKTCAPACTCVITSFQL